jgi:hypothetical protein
MFLLLGWHSNVFWLSDHPVHTSGFLFRILVCCGRIQWPGVYSVLLAACSCYKGGVTSAWSESSGLTNADSPTFSEDGLCV